LADVGGFADIAFFVLNAQPIAAAFKAMNRKTPACRGFLLRALA
jgi:hypothetical protein